MNPPMTMEIDLASYGENGALDSEDSGICYQRRGYEFPEDVLRIIFDCIGPGHFSCMSHLSVKRFVHSTKKGS